MNARTLDCRACGLPYSTTDDRDIVHVCPKCTEGMTRRQFSGLMFVAMLLSLLAWLRECFTRQRKPWVDAGGDDDYDRRSAKPKPTDQGEVLASNQNYELRF